MSDVGSLTSSCSATLRLKHHAVIQFLDEDTVSKLIKKKGMLR